MPQQPRPQPPQASLAAAGWHCSLIRHGDSLLPPRQTLLIKQERRLCNLRGQSRHPSRSLEACLTENLRLNHPQRSVHNLRERLEMKGQLSKGKQLQQVLPHFEVSKLNDPSTLLKLPQSKQSPAVSKFLPACGTKLGYR